MAYKDVKAVFSGPRVAQIRNSREKHLATLAEAIKKGDYKHLSIATKCRVLSCLLSSLSPAHVFCFNVQSPT
jgi:hypothetical protein